MEEIVSGDSDAAAECAPAECWSCCPDAATESLFGGLSLDFPNMSLSFSLLLPELLEVRIFSDGIVDAMEAVAKMA